MLELTGSERADEIYARRQAVSGQGFLLSRSAIVRILEDFTAGRLSTSEVEHWADSLEAMGDVQYEDGHEGVIADVLFQLGAPEINRPLDAEVAAHLLAKLRQ
ncbi:MAG TPA: hypothetical protein VGE21_14990 [Flavobacteriales bacterium]